MATMNYTASNISGLIDKGSLFDIPSDGVLRSMLREAEGMTQSLAKQRLCCNSRHSWSEIQVYSDLGRYQPIVQTLRTGSLLPPSSLSSHHPSLLF